MKFHSCKICTSEYRDQIEGWRFHDRLKYQELQARIQKEFGLKVSLGTLSNHFQFVTDDIAKAVDSQIKNFVQSKAVDSMSIAVENIELARTIINQFLNEEGKLRIPDNVPFIAMLMKERRQSAELILKYSGASDGSEEKIQSLIDLFKLVASND